MALKCQRRRPLSVGNGDFWCIALLFLLRMTTLTALTLLSDLPTPSLVFSLQQVTLLCNIQSKADSLPTLRLSSDTILKPIIMVQGEEMTYKQATGTDLDDSATTVDISELLCKDNENTFAFIHSTVLKGRQDDSILAVIDAPDPSIIPAHLVLGLNNHHVGGYYWARSAGAGASMEAPGIDFVEGSILTWQDKQNGFTACNSNDGKRSEWVGFLKPSDTVQLIAHDVHKAITRLTPRIYGVTSSGRPLGSEPVVKCQYEVVDISGRASR